ncbi:S49 family peptidase [Qingshengfaniella alkalisoli]|uniref:S49 family peptidase n=1 Tax=Qingshengfaniella alkalisoli TaxID=2599296 RepID=A0A5B8I8H8_9RHOB|nr:S49 family peptidase [Qingshengfaniella alkalisoli]QDY70305.1 S49 family peptidase [Qingshengfaniella alkalisoli]
MEIRFPFKRKHPVVSVLRLQGVIASQARSGSSLNDATLAPLIEKAFTKGKPSAVALSINSPGGSPVQSSLIAARIRRMAEEKNIPVIAFVEDVAASGGYWLATAADEIFVDGCSIVGSIGVISAGFGAHEFITRHGIERRVHTAGKSKSILDPFRPEKPEDIERLNTILADMHDRFKEQVTKRRGAKLSKAEELFDGSFWLGGKALELGLVDSVGHLQPVMKERFGEKIRFNRFGPRKGLLSRFGVGLLHDAADVIEERASFARFGL